MSILVTGGTGFVGIHVLRQLAFAGESVVSVSTRGELDEPARAFLGDALEKVTCVRADVLNLEELRETLRRFAVGTVVHGAAVTAIGELEREALHSAVMINVGGTATILEASRHERVRRFIYLSSATIYGSGDPAVPLREDGPISPKGIYAVTKRAAEQIIVRYMELFGMEGSILRISAPYGPLERPTGRRELMSPLYEWCRAAAGGEEITLAEDLQRDFTYVVDTANAIASACRIPRLGRELYNVSSGCNVTFSEVLGTLSRLRPGFRFRRSAADGSSDFFRESLRGPLDITLAGRDLGYKPEYDLERGLKSYLDWLNRFPV